MTGRPRTPPRLSDKGRGARASREARLAEALRANLRKRKAQVRNRSGADEDPAPEPPPSPASGDEP